MVDFVSLTNCQSDVSDKLLAYYAGIILRIMNNAGIIRCLQA